MPRVIPANLQTEFDRAITNVGYLLHIHMGEGLRWSNLGTVNYQPTGEASALLWVDVDFDIEGLGINFDSDPTGTLTINNLDGAVASLFQLLPISDVLIDVYQFSRNALVSGDAPKIARMVAAGLQMGLDKIVVQLVSYGSQYQFAPARRVDPYYGFNFAMAEGTQLAWGSEIMIMEPSEDG